MLTSAAVQLARVRTMSFQPFSVPIRDSAPPQWAAWESPRRTTRLRESRSPNRQRRERPTNEDHPFAKLRQLSGM